MKTTHINIIVIILILLISFFIVKYNVKETFTNTSLPETIVNYTLRYGLYANDSSSKCGEYQRNERVFSTVKTDENIIGEREKLWPSESESYNNINEAINNFMNPDSKIENLRGIVIYLEDNKTYGVRLNDIGEVGGSENTDISRSQSWEYTPGTRESRKELINKIPMIYERLSNNSPYWDSSSWHDNFDGHVCRNTISSGPNDPDEITYKRGSSASTSIIHGSLGILETGTERTNEGYVKRKDDDTIDYSKDPRFYFIGLNKTPRVFFKNTEITLYFRRSFDDGAGYSGISIGCRSAVRGHSNPPPQGDFNPSDYYPTNTYYFRITVDGRYMFNKELHHPGRNAYYTLNTDWSNHPWSNGENTLPKNKWIGAKFIVYTFDNNKVKLEGWIDDVSNAGEDRDISIRSNWRKIIEFIDREDAHVSSNLSDGEDRWVSIGNVDSRAQVRLNLINQKLRGTRTEITAVPQDTVITEGGGVVLLRTSDIQKAEYKYLSIREIGRREIGTSYRMVTNNLLERRGVDNCGTEQNKLCRRFYNDVRIQRFNVNDENNLTCNNEAISNIEDRDNSDCSHYLVEDINYNDCKEKCSNNEFIHNEFEDRWSCKGFSYDNVAKHCKIFSDIGDSIDLDSHGEYYKNFSYYVKDDIYKIINTSENAIDWPMRVNIENTDENSEWDNVYTGETTNNINLNQCKESCFNDKNCAGYSVIPEWSSDEDNPRLYQCIHLRNRYMSSREH